MTERISSYGNSEAGTTAVEFALIAGAFLSLIFGIFEVGRLFLTWNTFQYALENATRYALVTEDVTPEELREYIADDMAGMTVQADNIDVDVTTFTLSNVNFIEIDGTYTFQTVVPLLPDSWNSFSLTASSRLPVP